MTKSRFAGLLAVVLALMLVAAACGNDDDGGDTATDATEEATEEATEAPAEEATQEATEAPADGATEEPTEDSMADEGSEGGEGETLQVGLLIPGIRNDNSFSQSAVEGLEAAAEEDGNIDFTIIEEIIEPTDSLPALRDFASRGYDLVIGHGIEYVDPIQELYSEFPDTDFQMTGGILVEGAEPADNVEDWLYNVQDMAYPNGIIAANATTGNTIGIVGGPEFDFVKQMHASFQEAALSVNPDLEFIEGFAGSFVDVQAAAEVAQSLIDQGADYIYCSGDGICIGAAQVASSAGVPISVGFGSQEDTAPDAYISASVIRMKDLYLDYFDRVRSDTFGNQFLPGSVQNGGIEILPINMDATVETAVPLEELQAILDDFVAQVQAGELEIPFPAPAE